MSNNSQHPNRKEAAPSHADRKKYIAERCRQIVAKFYDPTLPLNVSDFKVLLFNCLHDAYTHKAKDSIVTEEDVSTMYFMWEILEEVEHLKEVWNWPNEDEVERV